MWEFKPRPKSMALFGLRVPRGNKNWFAHSFVSIDAVGGGHAMPSKDASQDRTKGQRQDQLSLTCFSCHFYLSSQGNQFTMCLFVLVSRLPVNTPCAGHGPGYYDTLQAVRTKNIHIPPPLPPPCFWQFPNISAHMHVLQVIYLTGSSNEKGSCLMLMFAHKEASPTRG